MKISRYATEYPESNKIYEDEDSIGQDSLKLWFNFFKK